MSSIKILALSGSARRDSYNSKLVRIAAEGAQAAGAEVTVVDLREFPLPIFDEDLEKETGTPEEATRLKHLFIEHHGLLIASPEYNSSITPLLKNVIDWVSRPGPDGTDMLAGFRGKVAALMAASPGALGGLRGLVHVRAILGNIGVTVLPDQVAIAKAFEAFDEAGQLSDARRQQQIKDLGANLTSVLQKLHS